MKIAECLIFFNEIDLLKVHLAEHYDFVDTFYIIESTRTFSYLPKPLYFQENRALFSPWEDKIRHVVVDADRYFIPIADNTSANENEKFQRLCVLDQLDCDYFILSDCDEIYYREKFPEIIKLMEQGTEVIAPKMRMFYYFLDHELSEPWIQARIFKYPPSVILPGPNTESRVVTVGCVGCHFSYLGGAEKVQEKVRSFSHHVELERYAEINQLVAKISTLKDIFDRGEPCGPSILHTEFSYLPKHIQDNFPEYSKYLYRNR